MQITRGTAPAALAGIYARSVAATDFPDSAPGNTPLGTWKIAFGADGLITISDPNGGGADEAYEASDETLKMDGPANWREASSRQGGFCGQEPISDYSWHLAGATLTLRSTGDITACRDRAAIFDGTWTMTK